MTIRQTEGLKPDWNEKSFWKATLLFLQIILVGSRCTKLEMFQAQIGFLVRSAGRHVNVFGHRTGCSHRFSKIAFFTLVWYNWNSLARGHKLNNAIPTIHHASDLSSDFSGDTPCPFMALLPLEIAYPVTDTNSSGTSAVPTSSCHRERTWIVITARRYRPSAWAWLATATATLIIVWCEIGLHILCINARRLPATVQLFRVDFMDGKSLTFVAKD